MRSISKRTYFALILSCLLLFGLVAFSIRYGLFADKWISFFGSSYVEAYGGTIKIYDRKGNFLYSSADGASYSDDRDIRIATLHLLGDREGCIDDRIIPEYAKKTVSYDSLSGSKVSEDSEITLTVISEAQAAAMNALSGRKGVVGVMNYKTGEILCAVTSPSFDPDNPPDSEEIDDESGIYINRFFYSSYTPGSIFKLLTTAAAIETDPELLDRTFTCTGARLYNVTCPKAHGELTYREALAKSCNCAFSEIANTIGKDDLQTYSEKAGITGSLRFDGIVTKPGTFDVTNADANDLAWAGIGQYTNMVNPCEYLTFIAAIGNGGVKISPHIVQSVINGKEVVYSPSVAEQQRILESSTAEKLNSFMHYNAETVYNMSSFPQGLKICAKSGTAEVSDVKDNTATFAGFVDSEKYPLAFIIVVEEGRAGSNTCAPIAGEVISACVNAMN